MDWIDFLKPPRLELALDRLGLTPEDRTQLRARWMDALSDSNRLIELSFLYDRHFIKRTDSEDIDPIDAALLALLQVPVMEMTFRELKIDTALLDATLHDVGRWMAKERRVTGHFGLSEFHWVQHALTLDLIELGSLQFMPRPGTLPVHAFGGPNGIVLLAAQGQRYREDGWGADTPGLPEMPCFTTVFEEHRHYVLGHLLDGQGRCSARPVALHTGQYLRLYSPGDPVAEVHIPEGADLSTAAIDASFQQALAYTNAPFMGNMTVFTCHSWMLSPQLPDLVPGSHLAAFSNRWHRAALQQASDAQFWERLFDYRPVTRETAPRDTRLQRAFLDADQPILDSGGILFAEDFTP